jgi:4-carboxymuconolactone decarboxylase
MEARGSGETPSEGSLRRARAQGAKSEQLQELLCAVDPVLGEWADDFIFDQVWGRQGLSEEERMLVAIVALASIPNTEQTRNYLWGALQAGVSARKIHESLLMLVVYAGFPRALGPLQVWKTVLGKAFADGMDIDMVPPSPPGTEAHPRSEGSERKP